MRKTISVMAVFLTALFMVGLLSIPAFAQLTFSGASTITDNLMPDLTKVFTEKNKIKFDSMESVNSNVAFQALVDGKCLIAGVAKNLTADDKKNNCFTQIFGYDPLVAFVNEKNAVANLSKDQIKGIFTGKITNWKDVGGADAKITVVIDQPTSGAHKEFKKIMLDDAEYVAAKIADKPAVCVEDASKDANTVTYASISWKRDGVKAVSIDKIAPTPEAVADGDYILSRPLILVTKEVPKDNIKLFFDFVMSPEGQEVVGKKFVPAKKK